MSDSMKPGHTEFTVAVHDIAHTPHMAHTPHKAKMRTQREESALHGHTSYSHMTASDVSASHYSHMTCRHITQVTVT